MTLIIVTWARMVMIPALTAASRLALHQPLKPQKLADAPEEYTSHLFQLDISMHWVHHSCFPAPDFTSCTASASLICSIKKHHAPDMLRWWCQSTLRLLGANKQRPLNSLWHQRCPPIWEYRQTMMMIMMMMMMPLSCFAAFLGIGAHAGVQFKCCGMMSSCIPMMMNNNHDKYKDQSHRGENNDDGRNERRMVHHVRYLGR